ncbi:MAG: GNAT family N-acetyltransferase [Rhodoferax sp.]
MPIRPALPSDASDISALILSLSQHFTVSPTGQGAEAFLQSVAVDAVRAYIQSPRYHYLVARQGARLIGAGALRDHTHVFHLFVAQDQQGLGLGRRLWEQLRTVALAQGPVEAFTVNASANAQGFYATLGFVPTAACQQAHGIAFVPMRRVETAR